MKYIINEHVYAMFRGQLCNAVILAARMEEKLIGPADALCKVRIEYYERKGGHKEILEWELEDTALFRHPLWMGEREVSTQIKKLEDVRSGNSSDREIQVRNIEARISDSLETIKRYGFVDNTTWEKLEELFIQAKQILPASDSKDNHNNEKRPDRSIKTHKTYANKCTKRYPAQHIVHAGGLYQKRVINRRIGSHPFNQRVRVSVPRQLRRLTRGR